MPSAVERDESRRRVGDPLPAEKETEAREDPDPHAGSRTAAGTAPRVDEARPDHEVRLAPIDRREELPDLGGVVLAVAVEAHRDVVSLVDART